ncbi:unnamed protein product, partial [Amoebophrya sp. A25]
ERFPQRVSHLILASPAGVGGIRTPAPSSQEQSGNPERSNAGADTTNMIHHGGARASDPKNGRDKDGDGVLVEPSEKMNILQETKDSNRMSQSLDKEALHNLFLRTLAELQYNFFPSFSSTSTSSTSISSSTTSPPKSMAELSFPLRGFFYVVERTLGRAWNERWAWPAVLFRRLPESIGRWLLRHFVGRRFRDNGQWLILESADTIGGAATAPSSTSKEVKTITTGSSAKIMSEQIDVYPATPCPSSSSSKCVVTTTSLATFQADDETSICRGRGFSRDNFADYMFENFCAPPSAELCLFTLLELGPWGRRP